LARWRRLEAHGACVAPSRLILTSAGNDIEEPFIGGVMATRANVKNEKQYEALKDEGMSKSRAARIANSPGTSQRGGQTSGSGGDPQGGTTAQKKRAGRKGGKTAPSRWFVPDNPQHLLTIYLQDHLAGATAGRSLARRLARNHRGTGFEMQTADLARQIEQDRSSLLEIMDVLGVRPARVKNVLGLVGERVSRLKLNGMSLRRSPLSSVIEFEGMRLGVEGKTDGWQALREIADGYPRLDAAKLDGLLRRAGDQSKVLQDLRLQAAAQAFAPQLGRDQSQVG
jgi:hypothetical protein